MISLILTIIGNGFLRALSFFRKLPWYTIAIGALAILAALMWQRANAFEKRYNHSRAQYENEKRANDENIKAWIAARDESEKVQAETLARVSSDHATLNERYKNELEIARNSADDRYERLRKQAAAYRSIPRKPDMSAAVDAACITYSGTSCEGLPAKMKAAQDNTDQLIALIAAVKSQSGVK